MVLEGGFKVRDPANPSEEKPQASRLPSDTSIMGVPGSGACCEVGVPGAAASIAVARSMLCAIRCWLNGRWGRRCENAVALRGPRAWKGANPRSAAGGLNFRWGSKGVNRQEGSQTLKAEQRQPGKLPDQWTFGSDVCCREVKSRRGAGLLRRAG